MCVGYRRGQLPVVGLLALRDRGRVAFVVHVLLVSPGTEEQSCDQRHQRQDPIQRAHRTAISGMYFGALVTVTATTCSRLISHADRP